MRILTALIAAGLLFAVAVAGCHEKKNESTTPSGNMGDAGTEAAHPAYPPAQ